MAQKTVGIVGVLIIAVIAFAVGYWPEHQKYVNAIGDLRLADKQMNEIMGRQRIFHLENILLQALDHAAHKEYKEAQNLIAEFFTEVRADMARPDMSKFSPELKEILAKSDDIRIALEKQDAAAREMLRGLMQQLARMAGPPPTANEPPAILRMPPTSVPQS